MGRTLAGLIVVLAIEAAGAAALATVTLDLWAHRRVEQLGGVNVWGYRGSVMPQKRRDEVRIAFVGGDLAFGWGQPAGGTLASEVRRLVMLVTDRPGRPLHPITAVNISAQGLTAGEYGGWIGRFAYLRPDVVCIVADPPAYESWRMRPVPDRASGVFARFGYAPILPLVLQEKGAVARSRVVSGIGSALAAADHALAPGAPPGARPPYAVGLEADVQAGLRTGASVVLVLPPYYAADERADHDAVATMIPARFAADRRLRVIDLGDEPDIHDAALRLNDLDWAASGIARASRSIAPPVTQLVRAVIE
jgi:hypothetical protein